MSTYQEIKLILLDILNLSKDAVHIHVGFLCLVLVILFTKKKLSSFFILIPGFLVSLSMEILDLRDDYNSIGSIRIIASIHDLINTNLIPLCLWILAKYKKIRTNETI